MPTSSLSGKVAIVGIDESDRIGVVPDKSMLQLHAEGARNALRDAGLTLKDVDGLFTANIPPTEVGEYLGIEPKVVDGTNVGGCSFLIQSQVSEIVSVSGRGDSPEAIALVGSPARVHSWPPSVHSGSDW